MPPSYFLDDPRPIRARAPYTYFLPSDERIAAVGVGDLVQLIFVNDPPRERLHAERLWVRVTDAGDESLRGALETTPSDMPSLLPGLQVEFQRWHIISIVFQDKETERALPPSAERDYWDRCMVDQCVLDGRSPVGYLYREEADLTREGDKYPDSGWRIRGEWRREGDDPLDGRKVSYVAVGAVLNRDDSWLGLIDFPVGAAFERELESGRFVAVASS